MSEMYQILLIDDDYELGELLQEYLAMEGYQLAVCHDGESGLAAALTGQYDLVLLDVMLPKMNGFDVLKQLRTESMLPVIMLTARGDSVDRVLGLEHGADDYIPKPFNPRELLARIKAILRRRSKDVPGAPTAEENLITFGEFTLNLATREMGKGDEVISLTSGEFAVLKALVTHPREPLSRDKLMNLARGRDYSALERSIDVQVSRLRRMVEVDPASPRYIQTVWGLGYVFVPDGDK